MPAPDPSRIVDTLCAYWQTATVVAAIDLGLFTAVGRRSRSVPQLADDCGADRAAMRTLCDALVSMGYLRVRAGRYRSAPDAARFLDAGSPDYLGGIRSFFNAPPVTTAFNRLPATVRRGTAARRPALDERTWKRFAAAAAPLRRRWAAAIARDLDRRGLHGARILDVGAGASPLGIELLLRWPSASLVVQDRAAVAQVALQHAAAAGVGHRVTLLRGDATRLAWGGPFDLVLMVNLLDYLDERARRLLLRKARAALTPNGLLVVCAPLLDAGRHSPPEAVTYSLLLLALGAAGSPSTFAELKTRLRACGFGGVTRCRDLPVVLARRQSGSISGAAARSGRGERS